MVYRMVVYDRIFEASLLERSARSHRLAVLHRQAFSQGALIWFESFKSFELLDKNIRHSGGFFVSA